MLVRRSLALLFALLLIASCGGDDDGPVTPGPTEPLVESIDINGTVAGPVDPAGMQVLGYAGAATVAEGGAFSLTILAGGGHLAAVVDDDDRAVYLGLLAADDTIIDVNSTARALLFFAIGGPLLSDDLRPTVFDDAAFVADAATLAQAIEDAYEAGGTDLVDIAGDLQAALADLSLLSGDIDKTLVDPPGGSSGIDLDTTVENQLTLRNNFRRRALAWVDRISGVDAEGTTVPYDLEIAEVNISPTVGYSSVIGTLVDAVNGNYMWAPVASQPIPTPVMPTGGQETTYQVTVLGLGGTLGDYYSLPAERANRYTALALRSIIADFVTPIIVNIAIPQYSNQIDDLLESLSADNGLLADLVNLTMQGAPGIVDKALAGDLQGAVNDAVNFFWTSATVDSVHKERLIAAVGQYLGTSAGLQFERQLQVVGEAVTVVNIIGTILDTCRQARDILDSDTAEQWDVTVTAANLTLTPARMQILPGEYAPFTVTVQDAGDRAFEYRWSCDAGQLRDDLGHAGQAITTSRATVEYHAQGEGEDVAAVEVYEIRGTDRVYLGEVSAPVDVREARPLLVPRRTSLAVGDWEVFEMRMAHGYQGEARLFYRWTGGDRHGEHDGSPFVGTDRCVTYTAASVGVDTLACEVFMDVNGRMESLGSATAEIRVEDEPTIIHGHYYTHDWPNEDGTRYGVYADVVWQAYPDAVSYRLYGYGGYDDAYYLGGPITGTIYANDIQHDHADDMPAGDVWTTLSTMHGPIDQQGSAIAWMEGRFATGWVWEVEVIR